MKRCRAWTWLTGSAIALAIISLPKELQAKAGPRVQASNLPCFAGPRLGQLVRDQLGARISRPWTLRLRQTRKGSMTLTLSRAGRRIGLRRFSQLPERCEEQRQLVATVAILAIESWRAEQQTQPKTRRSPSDSSQDRAQGNNEPSTVTPDPTTPDPSDSGATGDTNPDNPSSDTSPSREENRNPEEDDDAQATETEESNQERRPNNEANRGSRTNEDKSSRQRDPESTPDAARVLAQRQAERQARAQRQRSRQPFRPEGGVGMGAAWGIAAQVGPELEGWVGARRPRLSLRAGLRLNYGLPRSLGPIRLHSGSASATLQLCLRPGAQAPAGAMEFWICLGGMGGMVIAGGQGSDQDRQGLRPTAAPTISVELPVARRGRDHWSIGLRGGINLVRTRFELGSTQKDDPLLHSYTAPAFHLALQIRWRRHSAAR